VTAAVSIAARESQPLELPKRKGAGKPVSPPRWTTSPHGVVSLVLHGDHTFAVVTAGPRPGKTTVTAEWLEDHDGKLETVRHEQDVTVKPRGKNDPAPPPVFAEDDVEARGQKVVEAPEPGEQQEVQPEGAA
jgi:hypothetical protein